MKEYNAYLIFNGLGDSSLKGVSELAKKFEFEIDFNPKFLEFEYSGRDAPLNVIKFFYRLAKIVENAEGELICEIVNDDGDNEFEFYRIQNGKLIFQSGKIVRGTEEVVEIE